MPENRNRKQRYAVALGLLFSAVFVALSLRRIDLGVLWQTLRVSEWWPWYVLAPIIYMTGQLLRGIRCRVILRPHCEISTWTASNVVIIGYAANNLLPARMGEFVRAYVLSQRAGVSVSLSLAVTFLERLLDGLAITFILLLVAMTGSLPEWGDRLLWMAASLFVGGSLAVLVVTAAQSWVMRVTQVITRPLPTELGKRITAILRRALGAADCIRDPGLAAKIVVLSITVWVVEGTMFLVILPAFHLPANPIWAGVALSVTNLGILIPSAPGYIGSFHYFCMRALQIFSVPKETALGYAMMAHLLYYVPVTLWGVAALMAYGVNPSGAARRVSSKKDDLAAAGDAEGVEVPT